MSLKIDRVQLDIVINNDQARVQLRNLEGEARKLTTEMNKMVRGSDEYVKKSAELTKVKAQMDSVYESIGTVNMTMRELTLRAKELSAIRQHLRPGTEEFQKIDAEIKAVNTRMGEMKGKAKQTGTAMGSLGNEFKTLLPALGIAGIIASLTSLGTKVFDVQKKFQTFRAVLNTSLGSSVEAATSLDMIEKFASKTPFSIEQLVGSFIKLVNRGFKPTKEELTKMGDLASSTGKDFDMLVEAILDAETGEFERLKEFGIKAKVSGDQVTLAFKGVKTTIDNNAESLRAYILSLGNVEGVLGSMAAISETLAGKTSNLGDAWTMFLKTLGDGNTGPLVWVVEKLTSLLGILKDVTQVFFTFGGSKDAWAVQKEGIQSTAVSLENFRKEMESAQGDEKRWNLIKKDGVATLEKQLVAQKKLAEQYKNKIENSTVVMTVNNANQVTLKQLNDLKVKLQLEQTIINTTTSKIKVLNDLIGGEDKQTKKALKGIEDKIGAYQQLTTKVSELNQQLQDMYASGITPSAEFLANLKAQEQKVIDITNAVAVAKNGFESYLKLLPDEPIPDNTDYSTPEDKNPITGEPMAVGDKMSPEDKKAFAIAQAQTTSNALFDIVRNRQQAEFDHKMNLLQKEKELELSNKNLTEEQKADIEKKYLDKERKLKTEAYKKEKAASIIQAVINTALAIMNALATGGPAAVPLSIAAGIVGAAQIAVITSQKVPEFASGRYNVTGAKTGKQYNNVPFAGQAVTGLYSHPALVAENGSEMIIDSRTTKNLMMNYPAIIDAIHSARMPQYASGRYPAQTTAPEQTSGSTIPDMSAAMLRFSDAVEKLQKDGVRGNWSLFDLEKIQRNKSQIESATNM